MTPSEAQLLFDEVGGRDSAAHRALRPRRRGGSGFFVALGVLAAALFAGLAGYVRSVEEAVVRSAKTAVEGHLTADGGLRPVAELAEAVRAMKLVTVEYDTAVRVETGHESWRGDVAATLRVPARFYYGTDLSELSARAVSVSPLGSSYAVRVPPPERIATEVHGGEEDVNVRVGWGRFRSRAGEYYLGLARAGVYERARGMALPGEEMERVRAMTREQIAGMVRSIVGNRAVVTVVFEDEGGW